jgi:hypothetical protein
VASDILQAPGQVKEGFGFGARSLGAREVRRWRLASSLGNIIPAGKGHYGDA